MANTLRADEDTSLASRIVALTDGETDAVALMATIACEVHHSDARFDWTGFYRVVAPELLKIGPYQGGHGCLMIPFSKGVCGAAARTGAAQIVADVEAFPGHRFLLRCSDTGLISWDTPGPDAPSRYKPVNG